jgi:hypothetical protein
MAEPPQEEAYKGVSGGEAHFCVSYIGSSPEGLS